MEPGEEFRQAFNFQSGICELIIDEVFLEDQGEISCSATNEHGQDTTTGYLRVNGWCNYDIFNFLEFVHVKHLFISKCIFTVQFFARPTCHRPPDLQLERVRRRAYH